MPDVHQIANSEVDVGPEAPNSKHQHPEKIQVSNSDPMSSPFWRLMLGAFLELGSWPLEAFAVSPEK
jgi:hypothetical protein